MLYYYIIYLIIIYHYSLRKLSKIVCEWHWMGSNWNSFTYIGFFYTQYITDYHPTLIVKISYFTTPTPLYKLWSMVIDWLDPHHHLQWLRNIQTAPNATLKKIPASSLLSKNLSVLVPRLNHQGGALALVCLPENIPRHT